MIERSRRQALINVVVLNVQPDGQASGAVPAEVTGFLKIFSAKHKP